MLCTVQVNKSVWFMYFFTKVIFRVNLAGTYEMDLWAAKLIGNIVKVQVRSEPP